MALTAFPHWAVLPGGGDDPASAPDSREGQEWESHFPVSLTSGLLGLSTQVPLASSPEYSSLQPPLGTVCLGSVLSELEHGIHSLGTLLSHL